MKDGFFYKPIRKTLFRFYHKSHYKHKKHY